MREMEHLQLDPLVIVARAQDLALQSRVIDYHPDDWALHTYERRRFFDWGGWLAVRPMDELPYWRRLMQRERDNGHLRETERDHHETIEEMRRELRERGTIANRDFAMSSRTRTDNYRGRKDSAVALYYLWRIGEAMVHHRERFERVYAPTEAIAPEDLIREATDAETDEFMLRKGVAFEGLWGLSATLHYRRPQLLAWRDRALRDGTLIEVRVEGWRAPRFALAEDAATLETLERGRVPRAWRPLETSTEEEATFLSPLDPVSARGRAKTLFDFDYKWEVYTPAPQRKFGYYALPVLWGDRLVARFDTRFDRSDSTLRLLGMWLEDDALERDEPFLEAFVAGMERFGRFLSAEHLDTSGMPESAIRRHLQSIASD
jgi:uncharacterized protein